MALEPSQNLDVRPNMRLWQMGSELDSVAFQEQVEVRFHRIELSTTYTHGHYVTSNLTV
jgi:hypothetical protein